MATSPNLESTGYRYVVAFGQAIRCHADRWFTNHEEIEAWKDPYAFDFRPNPDYSVDPWDPDSDDDGLTDGQEVMGLTERRTSRFGPVTATWHVRDDPDVSYETSPVNPDTDGDAVTGPPGDVAAREQTHRLTDADTQRDSCPDDSGLQTRHHSQSCLVTIKPTHS